MKILSRIEHKCRSENLFYDLVRFDIISLLLQLFEQMCVALGGRVAESITFNSVTSGMSFYGFVILHIFFD